jgi:hypothetical protein
MEPDNESLTHEAYRLGEEIHDGRWSHISDLKRKPATACTELIDELRRRCPGYTISIYQQALADGLFASR